MDGEVTAGVTRESAVPGCWEKVNNVVAKLRFPVTLEPLVALYTISVGLNEVIRSNLVIEKICQARLNYTAEVCGNLTNLEDTQKIVQESVADYEALYSTISFVPKILYALLAGTWSDQHGRKVLLCLPVLGQFLASITYGLNYFFLTSLPWQFLFLELVNDLCGTYVAYYLAVYSYITDITPGMSRTYRLSVVDGVDYVSTSIGTRISGPLYITYLGYYGVFGCSAATCVLAFLYLVFMVKESLRKENVVQSVETPLHSLETPLHSAEQTSYGSQNVDVQETSNNGNWFSSSFLFIIDSLRTVFKPRKGARRLIVLLGVFNFACYIFTYNGTEGTHRYYFAQRKYGWSEQEMSMYLFDYRLGYMVSLWVLIPILTKLAGMADTTIAIVACLTSSVGFILPAVTGSNELFRSGSFVLNWFSVGSFICLLSPVTTITTRSVISRAVPGDEIGRIYSVLALFSAASGSLVEAAFQALYSATISSFLGSYLCVLAGLLVFTIPVNLVIKKLLATLD